MKPAGWVATALLFGVPALIFVSLFHWLGPELLRQGTSWWRIFHLLLILPLTLILISAFLGAAIDGRSVARAGVVQRLRLSVPGGATWLWAVALSGFMYGGTWADLLAVACSWMTLWKENTSEKWLFAATAVATLIKRNVAILQPALQAVRFFHRCSIHAQIRHG
jgi:hypothetical protein